MIGNLMHPKMPQSFKKSIAMPTPRMAVMNEMMYFQPPSLIGMYIDCTVKMARGKLPAKAATFLEQNQILRVYH